MTEMMTSTAVVGLDPGVVAVVVIGAVTEIVQEAGVVLQSGNEKADETEREAAQEAATVIVIVIANATVTAIGEIPGATEVGRGAEAGAAIESAEEILEGIEAEGPENEIAVEKQL